MKLCRTSLLIFAVMSLVFGIVYPLAMTGLAGIGYGLLRLAEPTRVPSLLTVAPPL